MALHFPLFSTEKATREGSHSRKLPSLGTDVLSSQHNLVGPLPYFSLESDLETISMLPSLLYRLYKINYGLLFLLKLCKASSANSLALLFIWPSFFGRRLL
jgi:hypothetical protein